MSATAVQFLKRWMLTTVAVLVAAKVVDGIHYDDWTSLLVASLALGFLNAFVRPLLLILSLPLLLVTLGFFLLVINALLLWAVGAVVKGFHVDGFWSAFWGAMIMSLVNLVFGFLLGTDPPLRVRRTRRPPDADQGPVIDV